MKPSSVSLTKMIFSRKKVSTSILCLSVNSKLHQWVKGKVYSRVRIRRRTRRPMFNMSEILHTRIKLKVSGNRARGRGPRCMTEAARRMTVWPVWAVSPKSSSLSGSSQFPRHLLINSFHFMRIWTPLVVILVRNLSLIELHWIHRYLRSSAWLPWGSRRHPPRPRPGKVRHSLVLCLALIHK